MINRKNITILIIFLFIPLGIRAQFYSTGNDPAKAKWMELKSENYRIIYPQEIDSLAKRYAFLLEEYRERIIKPYSLKPSPISVILHPYTTYSNGVVSWAPKRAEFYTSPQPYSGYSQNWEKQLVLHETRHIAQITAFTKGVYKYLHWFIGEQSTGIGVGLYPSRWFLESDAVVAETELSSAGRGRSADFLMYYRAAFLQGDNRNWDRWRFGSYKRYSPDVYAFGYLINSSIRYYGDNPDFSGELFDYLVKNFYNPAVIRNGYKKITGKTRFDHLQSGRELMTSIWRESIDTTIAFTPKEPLKAKRNRIYTEYISPVSPGREQPQTRVIAIKKGFENAAELVSIDSSGKERILRPFAGTTSKLQIHGNKLYWTETNPDPRWSLQTYSDIRSYDLTTKERRKLTNKEKYFNPSVSPDGKILAVTEYPVTGSSNLLLLDSERGEVLKSIPAPQMGQIRESAFIGGRVYATIISEEGIAIYSISHNDLQWQKETPLQFQTITDFRSVKDALIFRSDLDGVNNIYVYKPDIKHLQRLTNSEYGAAYPFLDEKNNELIYSDFNLDGYSPVKTAIDSLDWSVADFIQPYNHPVAELLQTQNKSGKDPLPHEIPEEEYKIKPYNKFKNLINIHSWAPVYYNVDKIMSMSYDTFYDLASLGAVAYSQNLLGTATTMLGYSYHNGFHSGHLKFSYSGLYPIFEISLDVNDRKSLSYSFQKNDVDQTQLVKTSTTDPYISGSILAYIPFNLSSSGWNRGIIPQLSYGFNNDLYNSNVGEKTLHKNQINYGVRLYQMRPIPHSGIYPKWGISLSLFGASAISRGEYFGDLAYIYGYLYTPGVTKSQGLRVAASYQRQFIDGKSFYLNGYASLPRGFSGSPSMKYGKLSFDYAIPVYLGDISLGWLAYLQRAQLIPFADMAFDIDNKNQKKELLSIGCDILFDTYFLRIAAPVSIGMRYARYDNFDNNYFGFLFNIAIP